MVSSRRLSLAAAMTAALSLAPTVTVLWPGGRACVLELLEPVELVRPAALERRPDGPRVRLTGPQVWVRGLFLAYGRGTLLS